MTMTRPWRRMIRHLLQIFLTLGLTFTVCLTSFRARVPSDENNRYLRTFSASLTNRQIVDRARAR